MRYFFLLSFMFSYLYAIVDIARIDFQEKAEGFSGAAYGSFQKKQGNTNKEEAEYGGRIQYDTKTTITWLQAEVEKDKANDIDTDDNAFIHLRHIRQLYSPSFAMEYFVQMKKDKFKNVKSRNLIGVGPRYKAVDSPDWGKVFLGVSIMDEQISYLSVDPLLETDPNEHNYRMSAYASYKIPVNNVFDISFLAYYQPKLDRSSDYLILSYAEMTVHLTKVLDLSYLMEFEHDSTPPTGVKFTDTVQKLSFVYRFGEDDPFSSFAHNFLKSLEAGDDLNTTTLVVEVETKVDEIEGYRDTLAGIWSFEKEKFHVSLDGTGTYRYDNGIYAEKFLWKLVSTQTQEGSQSARDQSTKLVIISFVDEEGREERKENYLWSENSLVGLSGSSVRHFKRP